mgnify:CR=1 FL=1
MSDQPHALQTVTVWDLPTRLFHWTLVALMIFQWLTAEFGSAMDWHVWGGYAILALVVFRLIWGFVGSDTVRFRDFVRGPGAALGYLKALLRGETPLYLGHNPMGGWSIVAMLALLLVQAGTGLFSRDDILTEGPLVRHVSKQTSNLLTGIHEINATVLYVLIATHLVAVFGYLLVKKENLIRPMLTGRKPMAGQDVSDDAGYASGWVAAVVLAVAAGIVWYVVTR